jgi:uncharacterized protein
MTRALLFLFFTTIIGLAASFECNDKSTQIEKTICKEHAISSLDTRLNNYFNAIKRSLVKSEQKKFAAEQISWLKERDETCNIENNKSKSSCLSEKYTKRLLFLRHKYENVLFNFPQETEINTICSELARNPKEYIKRFEVIGTNKFDINNDGINETIKCHTQGTMNAPYCKYLNNKSKNIEISEIMPRECCSYGLKFLNINNRLYKLTAHDDSLHYPDYLLYTTPSNEEYILCKFQNKTVEQWTYNYDLKDSKQICDAAIAKKQNIEFTEQANKKIQKNDRFAFSSKADNEGQLDFDNDGIENNLVTIEYVSGAGRGCDFSYYDELNAKKDDFANSKSRGLLIEMQNIHSNSRHPNCGGGVSFFKYANKNYMEYKAYDGHKVLLLENGEINTVCTSSKNTQTTIRQIKPMGKIITEETDMDFFDKRVLY